MKILRASDFISSFSFPTDLYSSILSIVRLLEASYPDIETWYRSKVIPDVISRNREILFVLKDTEIVGISIIKSLSNERKICTLRVSDMERGKGIATQLLRDSIQCLRSTEPLISVCSDQILSLLPLLTRFDFKMTQIYPYYYTESSIEYVFNGYLVHDLVDTYRHTSRTPEFALEYI